MNADGSWDHELTDDEAAFLAGYFAAKGWSDDVTLDQVAEAVDSMRSFKADQLVHHVAGHG